MRYNYYVYFADGTNNTNYIISIIISIILLLLILLLLIRLLLPRRLPSQRSNQILNTVSKLKPAPYLEHQVPPGEQPSSSLGTLPAQLCLDAGLGASGPRPCCGQRKGRPTETMAGREAHGFSPPFYYSFPLIFI